MAGRREWCGSCIGTSFRSRYWLTLDFCGILCLLLSVSVHAFALTVIALKLISGLFTNQIIFGCFYVPCAILAYLSLLMAWKTDPGAVPMGARPLTTFRRSGSDVSLTPTKPQRAIRRCHKCNDNYKPPRAHHDSVTGRCIVKFDHFCPWVGNAIGAMNHKFFVLFIFYTLLTSILAIVLIVVRLIHCGHIRDDSADQAATAAGSGWGEKSSGDGEEDPAVRALKTVYVFQECQGLWDSNLVLALLVCSVVFLVFTCVMLVEQLDAIESNTSKIARMKMSVGQGGTELTRVTHDFNEMFGGESPGLSWHWLLPLPVKFPKGMDKIVLGYEWDESFERVPYVEPGDVEEGGEAAADDSILPSKSDHSADSTEGLVASESASSLADAVPGKKGMRKRGDVTLVAPTFVGRTNQII